MSTTTEMSAAASGSASGMADLTEKQQRILAFLRERADTKTYFKSRLIGEKLDLSAKEVGTNMTAIRDGEFDIDVEEWGYSSSTTWKVTT